jgi:hypothetical protein
VVVVSPSFHASFYRCPARFAHCVRGTSTGSDMPSLFRFLTVVAVLGGLIYGGMFALANWFDPKPREISVPVPQDKFAKQR